MATTTTDLPLRYSVGTKVAPGDKLGSAKHVLPGMGTYIRGGNVYASAVGTIKLDAQATERAKTPQHQEHDNEERETQVPSYLISIQLEQGRKYASTQILKVGQTILGKVCQISHQNASIEIVASTTIGSLREHHSGVIRKEDVRTAASQEVDIYESFRPGDIVSARIISLGDSRKYFLSTAENDLGVVKAVCESSGEVMVPISWKEMECPKSGVRELRKCAKPNN